MATKRTFHDLDQYRQFLNNLYGGRFDHSQIILADKLVPIKIKCNTCTYWFDILTRHHQAGKTICQYCSGRLMNAEIFIKKSQAIHPNENYDYSKVIYSTNKVKVDIICPQHGIFPQTPNNHLKGQKCPHCQGLARHTTKSFIEKANKVHNNLYDYSKTIYGQNNGEKVIIICKIHGEFPQTPDSHLSGHGCPNCYGNVKWTKDQFIEKANKIHHNKYDYSKFIYVNGDTKSIVICPIHKEFEQRAKDHLLGKGCYQCGIIMRAENKKIGLTEFIKQSNIIHNNKYDYSKSIYTRGNIKTIIICPKHGEFPQTPRKHLGSAQGCPKCITIISKPETQWLDLIGILPEYRNISIKYGNNKRCRPDGFDPATNTIYEFDGDFWHGNPTIYTAEDFNPITKTTFGFLYQKTINRKLVLLQSGYQVISIWGSEFKLIQDYINICPLNIKTQIINSLQTTNGSEIINQFQLTAYI